MFCDQLLILESPSRELKIFMEEEVLDESDDHLWLGEIPETHVDQSKKARHLFKSSVLHADGKQFPSSIPPLHEFMPASMSSCRIVHI